MPDVVNPTAVPRTRRAAKSEETRRRILAAAEELFLTDGYGPTAIGAIAQRADVAVETVYARFGNKVALLEAILAPAVVGTDTGSAGAGDLFDRPEFARIRACRDQREQVRLLAAFSRGILQRTERVHRILSGAASVDPRAAELREQDTRHRVGGQRRYIDTLIENGPLRTGLSFEEAAATYSALANPSTYALFTRDLGWSPDAFEGWLAASLTRLLLDD